MSGFVEVICPDCHVERADYEGPNGRWLPQCPNCGSERDPRIIGTSGTALTTAQQRRLKAYLEAHPEIEDGAARGWEDIKAGRYTTVRWKDRPK